MYRGITVNEWGYEATHDFTRTIEGLLPLGHRLYQLPDLGEASEHDWGWVVGVGGFIEYVAIAEDGASMNLLVASDD